MNEFTQISRMIRILQLLSTRKSLTTTDLLDYFDHSISRRTLQRDMLALSENGVPLVNDKVAANENIWYLMDHFKQFIPVPLEMNEYLALEMLRANLTVFKNTSIEEDVEKLTKKIEQILPENLFLQSSGSEPSDIFTNYAMGEYDYSGKNDIINNLIKAITQKCKCLVTYDSPTAQKESKFYIEPEKLLTYHGGLYVIFYARGQNEFWLLAVHRILDLEVLDEVFEDDHSFDETEFLKHRFGLFGGEAEIIKLKFDKSIRHYIEHKHWHPTQKITPDKNGNLTLEMETATTPELTSWIMSWHKNVKVMKPKGLSEEIKENLITNLKNYE